MIISTLETLLSIILLLFKMEDFNTYTRFLEQLTTYVGQTGNNVLDLLKVNCDSYTYSLINQEIELFANELINKKYFHVTEKIEEMLSTPLKTTVESYEGLETKGQKYMKEIDMMLTNRQVEKGDQKMKGIFKNGQLNGQGKLITQEIEIKEGIFENNKLNGKGKISYSSGNKSEGMYKNDKLDGEGKYTFCHGEICEGVFENGQLNGEGKIVYPDGTISEGSFENSLLSGKGKVTYSTGEIIEGIFKNNKLNGQGKVVLSNGEILEGIFENGVLDGYKAVWIKYNLQKVDKDFNTNY